LRRNRVLSHSFSLVALCTQYGSAGRGRNQFRTNGASRNVTPLLLRPPATRSNRIGHHPRQDRLVHVRELLDIEAALAGGMSATQYILSLPGRMWASLARHQPHPPIPDSYTQSHVPKTLCACLRCVAAVCPARDPTRWLFFRICQDAVGAGVQVRLDTQSSES